MDELIHLYLTMKGLFYTIDLDTYCEAMCEVNRLCHEAGLSINIIAKECI